MSYSYIYFLDYVESFCLARICTTHISVWFWNNTVTVFVIGMFYQCGDITHPCSHESSLIWKVGHRLFTVIQTSPTFAFVGNERTSAPFRYFPNFSPLSKYTSDLEYHVYIWQVSPQLSCGNNCQIWMWFKEHNRYICKIENYAYGEINQL